MISLIIPAMNEEKHIPYLLDSIKNQKFKDYEIIVADAGSEDNTVNIIEKYGCILVKGGFVSKGRNNGAKVAKSDILLFLDSDVVLPPSFLENAVREFKKRGLGIAGFPLIPLNGKKIDKIAFNCFNWWAIITQKFSPHAASVTMASKKFHDAIGGIDESIVFVEDYSYARAMADVSKYGFINEPFFTSIRRYERDGRVKTYIKYFLAELHVLFLGPVKTDIFKYRFNHYNKP